MTTARKQAMSLYVDRGYPANWIVRDGDGRFWVVPPGEGGWERRRPFQPTDETELEAVPGHYLYMLGLPV
jgi:hypothetical protein